MSAMSSAERLQNILLSQSIRAANLNDRVSGEEEDYSLAYLPMISLPDNDTYWSESYTDSHDLCIVSSSSSLPSSSSVSPYSSSSASPSLSSNSSSSTNPTTNSMSSPTGVDHSEIIQINDLNSDAIYLESFANKEQLIFFGQDCRDMPLILSYKMEQIDSVDHLRAILRYFFFFDYDFS